MCSCKCLGVVYIKRFNTVKALGTDPGNELVLQRYRVTDSDRETNVKIETRFSVIHIYVCMYKLF